MDENSGILKCPKCGVEKAVASFTYSGYYSTWIVWKKRENKWIIGCVGYKDEYPYWWWSATSYIHEKNGDKKCWDKLRGSTEEEWTKKHNKWKCEVCGYHSTTFLDFVVEKDENDNPIFLNNLQKFFNL